MDRNKIERSAKAILEQKLKQKSFRMDLVWNVQNGELYWNSGHKVGKEMLDTLIGAFGSKETVLAKVSA